MDGQFVVNRSKLSIIVDGLLAPEARKPEQIFTVLNGVTTGRFIVGLKVAKRIEQDPGANWKAAAAVMALDKESWLAKLGDLPKVGKTFQKFGFRRSEVGRIMDPVADTVLGLNMLKAGITSGAVPKWLGLAAMTQKASTASITAVGVARGRRMEVKPIGQWGEAVRDVGLTAHLAAESLDNPIIKKLAKVGAATVTLTGMAMSGYALAFNYIPQAFANLPEPVELDQELVATDQVN